MPISMQCPTCGKKLNAPDSAAGKRARCPQCKTIVTLPSPGGAPAEEVLEAEPVQAPAPADPDALGFGDEPAAPAPPPLPSGGFGDSGDIPLAPDAAPPPAGAPGGDQPRRPCPMCGEMIPVSAVQCRFCHEIFDPALKKAQKKKMAVATDGDDDLSTGEWVVAILCSGIGCICGIIWMIQGKPKGKKMFAVSFVAAVVWSVIRGVLESASPHHGR
jgi:hypothetical protein